IRFPEKYFTSIINMFSIAMSKPSPPNLNDYVDTSQEVINAGYSTY
ncbi:9134_t:CDS:1, partial [Funneliformis mosseae]